MEGEDIAYMVIHSTYSQDKAVYKELLEAVSSPPLQHLPQLNTGTQRQTGNLYKSSNDKVTIASYCRQREVCAPIIDQITAPRIIPS